ncbi:type II secretion system protein GspM [Komagataeibacter sp. FNDCR2]|uniref:type II secretion system protein GspM n=1 Tax=Komagataeibacter sp. FNDCR2 TaxID=2878682 RepID=UPI001E4DF668|nr:type II secretion system protein GspM [Komagataeibacter sp. FNDCR2]MCE2574232.1 type II secretion system protein M [Komagataeibacter sp. FNDCR2]
MTLFPTGLAAQAALPEGRKGRVLAVGLGLVFLLLLWNVVVMPLWGWYQTRAEALNAKSALVAHMAARAAALPALRRQAASAPPVPAFLLEGANDTVAAAALQEKVQQMAAEQGTSLSSVETLGAVSMGRYRRIGVSIATVTSFPALIHLLDAVEQASPILLVDDLQLRGAEGNAGGSPMLQAAMTVLAFRRGDQHDAPQPQVAP